MTGAAQQRHAGALGAVFDARRNSLDALRLLFAALVAVAHGIVIRTGWQPSFGTSTLGDFGLDGFFVLSGFLVTRSFLRLGSPVRFAWHRFLRIMPGFWVCLLVTAFVVAPLAAVAQGLPAGAAFTSAPNALRYVLVNSGLLIVQYDIGGLLANTPNGSSFNGSLWTLAFEAFCYVIVFGLGVAGVLRRRPWVVPALAGVLTALTIVHEAGGPVLLNERITRLTLVFLIGASAYLYRDRIQIDTRLGITAIGVFLASVVLFDDYRVLGVVPFAYAVLWIGTRFPRPWTMRADLSYGVYIYHWPLFQLLGLTGLATLPTAMFVPLGLLLVLAPAALSWFLVERPALSCKDVTFRRRRPTPVPDGGAETRVADHAGAG